jgi:peptide/nickel transport system substrate-binding protein
MAGPYRIAGDDPGMGVVLTRNPSYHGNRPRRFARIDYAAGMTPRRSVAEVERGTADDTDRVPNSADARLRSRYGPKRYFVVGGPQLDYFALNTHRPLFADVRMRQAVNYAIDRSALDRLGDEFIPLPEHEIDHYIPPGLPGYRDTHVYPPVPDLARARRLAARPARNTLVLDVCDVPPCRQQAQIVKTDLARIGLRVRIERLPDGILFARARHPEARWDMSWGGEVPDYRDPSYMLNDLLLGGAVLPSLADASVRARLAAADRLSGAERYLAYGRLDADLTRDVAPLVAFGTLQSHQFISARVGCAFDSVYGMDLGALCRR